MKANYNYQNDNKKDNYATSTSNQNYFLFTQYNGFWMQMDFFIIKTKIINLCNEMKYEVLEMDMGSKSN